MVDVVSGEGEWSDQETGDDKEARDEQGFPKELQLDPCRIVLDRAVDRQPCQERADNPREVYGSATAPATAMMPSISKKWASSSLPILLSMPRRRRG
jgi:hypothetical protein